MSTFERREFADQLSIETPEGVELRFPVAGIGSRGYAALLDHLFQFAFYFVLGILLVIWSKAVGTEVTGRLTDKLDSWGKWFIAAVIFVFFLLEWGYFALFEAFRHGQTPGKRIVKLRVIKDAGRQITLFEALARNLLRFLDYFPTAYLVGIVTMACNRHNKRLGDLAAGTLVVHERTAEQPLFYGSDTRSHFAPGSPAFTSSFPGGSFLSGDAAPAAPVAEGMFPADAVARLDAHDLVVIDTFFARALDLPTETRSAMAYRIAYALTAKIGVPLQPGNPERALESLALQRRGTPTLRA